MGIYRIAVLPGDGIGSEVTAEALKVLREVEAAFPSLRFECKEYPTGARCYQETGSDLAPETLDACRAADAILFGAAGLPDIRFADGTEIRPQITLRFRLDLYAGVRPIKYYAGVPPVLAGGPAIDYVIVRENTEGLFASEGGGLGWVTAWRWTAWSSPGPGRNESCAGPFASPFGGAGPRPTGRGA